MVERFIALALVAAMLAGCSDAGSADTDDGPAFDEIQLEATSTTGILRGVVVDDAIRPLAGALVVLTGASGGNTTTTESGLFGFDGLQPGTYFLHVSKPGFFPVQQSAEVVAGLAEPPAVKVLLPVDATYQPYVTGYTYDGFIECTTNRVVLCGAPNTLENQFFCPGYNICYGNLTNDRFTWNFYYEPNMTWLQTEMAWESTQALSPELGLEMETLADGCEEDDYYFFERSASPLVWGANKTAIEETEVVLSPECPVYYSIFSGPISGAPVGFTIQQRFTAFSHSFYSYAPPEGWAFTVDGFVPPPPQ